MKKTYNYGLIIFGNTLYVLGLNLFITPIGLYSGGVYGICQLIRTWIYNFKDFGAIDIAGILYLIANIPLLILAFTTIGKNFGFKTIISVIFTNILLTFVTIKTPIITDPLTACIIGGIACGIGTGLVLRAGASGGGTEIVGMYALAKNKKISIGQINLLVNALVYIICGILFNLEIAIYSIIFSSIASIAMDKMHSQNIKINALIFTNNIDDITDAIRTKLIRGSTSWEGKGDYTGNKKYIISTVISKYEEAELKSIIKKADPNAFVIINRNIDTIGNVEKRLDA